MPEIPTKLTPQELSQYLRRLHLSSSDLSSISAVESLKLLHTQHLLHIPFDTSSLQLPNGWWRSPSSDNPVLVDGFKKGFEGVSVHEEESFRRVVLEGRGGYCFNLNYLFARLLVSLNYTVSLQGARVNLDRNLPTHTWSPITHLTLLVNHISFAHQFVCDIGFGGGSSVFPIDLIHNHPIKTFTKNEQFKVLFQTCPELEEEEIQGWTVQRYLDGYWSTCYHLYLNPLTVSDLKVYNWYNSTCPDAHFRSFMVVSILKANGSRRSLIAIPPTKAQPHQVIKVFTKEGLLVKESDEMIIKPDFKTLYETLLEEFGWGIPLDQR